ncbi:MAG TPA: hybrid sensor histidine kinase/response regulator [Cyanobacteria bacterium UBA11162]|nr:hybrid sensor histidine kinase/response regulator [Cyanobacteria bacterium UBA11162]
MKKILVIEDEESVRENLMDLLNAEDFEVLGAGDGCTGLNLAQQHLPDLIVCDVMMPKLDGFGVLNSLRKNPATAIIPFMFLTARTDKTDLRQGMELGADDYLTKPFTRAELLGAISSRLQKQVAIDQQQAKKMDGLRNRITQSLPHEMRSPLNSILGFSQLLVEEAEFLERQEIKEMSSSIYKSGQRLHRLIQNFLLYAELEVISTDCDRIQSLRSSQISSAAPVIEKMIRQQAKQVNREGNLQIELENSNIKIAKSRLEKIVEELSDNAFKYSAPGTPVRVVGTRISRGNPAESFYALSVSNCGRGMSTAQIAELGAYRQFDCKFYTQQGSGLGLIVTKRLAELIGGELTIESTPNEQTTVRVVLPI